LGGGDGAAVREILKYPQVKDITLVDLDPAMTKLAKTHPVLLQLNDSSFYDPKLTIKNMDAFIYMDQTKKFFDVIIIDLPDPRTVELGKLFSKEFYQLCRRHLRPNGLMIAQSGSPYYSTRAYECINKTMQAAGFGTTKIHNQVLTLGEWGWVIASKNLKDNQLKKALRKLEFKHIKTKWMNNESMLLMTSFGKDAYFKSKIPDSTVRVNTIHDPVLYRYYLQGNWELY
jgi:spermidine synthase